MGAIVLNGEMGERDALGDIGDHLVQQLSSLLIREVPPLLRMRSLSEVG